MRIFLTGGLGCLGSNLIENFLMNENEILVVDNFSTSYPNLFDNVEGLEIIEGNIFNKELLSNLFEKFKPEYVIHSAASYKNPDDWIEDCNTNIIGMCHLIELSKKHNIKKFINFQTLLAYGRPLTLPIKEDHPNNPFTSYGISKNAAENYLLCSDIPAISLRISNVTGARLSIGPIPAFYKRLKNGLSCFCSDTYRDFLDIQDFLDLINLILKSDVNSGIFNVGSGDVHSIKEIYDIVCDHFNIGSKEVKILPPDNDDVNKIYLDITKTVKVFGWKPKFKFIETINRQLKWYDDHGVDRIYSHLKNENDNLKDD